MRLKASHADPGACYIILNSHCCQRSRPLLKFCIDRADILLEGSPGSALLISQKQIVGNRGENSWFIWIRRHRKLKDFWLANGKAQKVIRQM